jgi:hypothetical protein
MRFKMSLDLNRHLAKGHVLETSDTQDDSSTYEGPQEEEDDDDDEVCSGEGEGRVQRMDEVVLSDSHDSSYLEDGSNNHTDEVDDSSHFGDTPDSRYEDSSHCGDTPE